MLYLKHLSYTHHEEKILTNINAHFQKGSFTALIGPNGAGKTTLFKIIIEELKPTNGIVHITLNNKLAYLPQRIRIDHTSPFTVFDVAAMGLWAEIKGLKGLSHLQMQKVYDTLISVGLKGFENRSLISLSGGEFQRLLFARLILQNADIILLDEPFAAVDEPTTQELMKILVSWHQQGKTIITILHDLELVKHYFPQTLLLAKKVLAFGYTKDVLTTENITTATFGALYHG